MKHIFVFIFLFFTSIGSFTQTLSWDNIEEDCPSSFADFLEGVAYAHILVSSENAKYISDNPNSGNAAIISGLIEYLEAMGFEKVTWGSSGAGNNSGSHCWWTTLSPSWGYSNNYFRDVTLNFYSCTQKKWSFSLGTIYHSNYSQLKNRIYKEFRSAYGYKKRDYNLEERCNYQSYVAKFDDKIVTKSVLKTYFDENGAYGLEGIYESVSEKSLHPRYEIGLLKSKDGYIAVYLDGANNKFDWIEGEWKASFEETATSGFFKIDPWLKANKSKTDEYFASYKEGGINIIMGGEETFYLKLYPTGNNISSSSGGSNYSSGTGFAINSNGYIATNYHVIEGANNIRVKGVGGDKNNFYPARVEIVDKHNDLAILKIEKSFGTIPYGMKTEKQDVASNVYAYGYPLTDLLGEEIRFTNGMINSNAGIDNDYRYYQHTASIQPGNSGGPLFNKYGNVVGINTLTVSKKFDDYTGIDTENIFFSLRVSYLTILMDNLGISRPTNQEIRKYSTSEQYKRIKNFVYIIEAQ